MNSVSSNIGSIRINNLVFPSASWAYYTSVDPIIIRTASSMPFADIRPGSKTCIIRATGYVQTNFNPFLVATPPYLNTFADIVCVCETNKTFARCYAALVREWNYTNDAANCPMWQAEFWGSFRWGNMGGINES